MIIAQLGRQPDISLAELAAVVGPSRVQVVSEHFATVNSDSLPLPLLGGTIKYGRIITTLPAVSHHKTALLNASRYIIQHYAPRWRHVSQKLTLGISAHDLNVPARDVQKTGLILKTSLKTHGVSLRLVPNDQPALSTATSHNNKLGSSPTKIELLIIRQADGRTVIAESQGVQNITRYTQRDRQRPRRDAFVGMLPPKLAQIMLNLALGPTTTAHVLDPFCGTGTVLQEALLRGCTVSGSDLNPKMIDYTAENLHWLTTHYPCTAAINYLHQADAMTHRWPATPPVDAVVCETYLGQPFSAPPRPDKLRQVASTCQHIIHTTLGNLHQQLRPGTPLCIAVPAWADTSGRLTYLPLESQLASLGYQKRHVTPLVYRRPNQVVARQLLVLETTPITT